MPQFPADLERPYGSLCGEGYSQDPPTDTDLLTVIPALHMMFVRTPLEVVELIHAYLPMSPDPPRRCHIRLYNTIDHGVGLCHSYCKGLETLAAPGFLTWWFFERCDPIEEAIKEYALAVAALQNEMERILPDRKEDATTEDHLRPLMSALNWDSVRALARTAAGTELLLVKTKRVLENTEDDPAALGCVFRPIMSLKTYWEPVFGTYKNVAAAVKQNKAVPQRQRGRRFMVDVAAFLSWIDSVTVQRGVNGFDPSDRSTWDDDAWDKISQQLADHLREKRSVRDEKRRSNG
jgi:hypothetical protein